MDGCHWWCCRGMVSESILKELKDLQKDPPTTSEEVQEDAIAQQQDNDAGKLTRGYSLSKKKENNGGRDPAVEGAIDGWGRVHRAGNEVLVDGLF
ncbi:hypothetical protein HN51_047446 [Arachis hypogaea]